MLKREFNKLVDAREDFKQRDNILKGAKTLKKSLNKYRQLLQILQSN